ncbi:hypothetical protein BDV96DRAFT_485186 [Lophiotrema nucula]|uniref:ubiquitinyl hydrolase 1 n=1 Tax=Lophiotrema nucula TaxID=690887 RepID=A0A6A5ZLE5_9PLEO|nr:hypothetical protein BDV96DRAFT_485186 [Lophiotrema nucula]
MVSVELSAEAVAYLLRHITLLPNPPQTEDSSPQHEAKLLKFVESCLEEFSDQFPHDTSKGHFATIRAAIVNTSNIRDSGGHIDPKELEKAFHRLGSTVNTAAIPIEVKAQNAGIIVHREDSNVVFETFELSPANAQVYSTEGRLTRSFPACAVAVSIQRFQEDGLQTSLARTIAKMSSQSAPGFQPKVNKAGAKHDEQRDTTKPDVVTSLLMSILVALGSPVKSSVLWKNTREDVFWSDSFMPWRRSPLWLLLRVTMQRHFRTVSGTSAEQDLYKPFMIFFLSRLMDAARRYHGVLGSEPIYVLSMKLLRRIRKLETQGALDSVRHRWLQSAQDSMITTSDLLKDTWAKIQEKCDNSLGVEAKRLCALRPDSDLSMTLPELDGFLVRRFDGDRQLTGSAFRPESTRVTMGPDELPFNLPGAGEELIYVLAEFESWVEHHLQHWTDRHMNDSTTCGKLYKALEQYYRMASSAYENDSYALSTMFLTAVELWIACDKSVCCLFPLLVRYDPEIPLPVLQGLLLPRRSQLERLRILEAYVTSRTKNSSFGAGSIFRDFGHPSSFAVKFFEQSPSHQNLLLRIEAKARVDKQNKVEQLRSLQAEYAELMRQHDSTECKYDIVEDRYGIQQRTHSHYCNKCSYRRQAERITIDIFEWSLPSDAPRAKATVFELDIPEAFGNWRDASVFLLTDVLGSRYVQEAKPDYSHPLSSDQGLATFRCRTGVRILPLSQVEPHMQTHRRTKDTPPNLAPEDVCLDNGLHYIYFDESRNVFMNTLAQTDLVLERCNHRLPARSSQLQKFIMRPALQADGQAPNEVISAQSECPTHMSLDEYKAFASLPLGENIQYLNVLAQLSVPSIKLAKVETHVLILQLVHQAGSPSDTGSTERRPHEVLKDEAFSLQLLSKTDMILTQSTENWETWRALAICAQLVLRLLTLTPNADIAETCARNLARIRTVCLTWIENIQGRVQRAVDDSQRADLTSRSVEIALVGVSTFDTDQERLARTLQHPEESSILIQCSMIISDSNSPELSEHKLLHQIMVQTWRSLSHRALPILMVEVIQKRNSCLDHAIQNSWATYQPTSSHWEQLTEPQDQWVVNRSSQDSSQLTVHFNLMTAELLVNGLPLARLPRQYTDHPMYAVLFSNAIMEVAPTEVTGFQLCSKHTFRGYQLFFGWQQSHMLVRAVKDEQTFDLIPLATLADSFPATFISSYVHWYDVAQSVVVFSPRDDPWPSDLTTGWLLTRLTDHLTDHWQLINAGSILVSIKSDTARDMAKIFSPIEDISYIHVIWDQASRELAIDIPRLRLSFYLVPGSSCVKSRQYRGMEIDSDQHIGTLTGLSTKLVLKSDNDRFGKNRMLLIPGGHVCYSKDVNHVSVTTKFGATQVHAYSIDELLGRLLDNGSLQSKLFLCYLHALTSHCLPDPLINQTGTEQALTLLRSGAVRSFDTLPTESVTILESIAKLAPGRTYYPQNLKVMQKVKWDQELGFLAQHSIFYVLVKDIFNQACRNNLFYPSLDQRLPKLDFIKPGLLVRDLVRTSTFRIATFGAEQFTTDYDKVHEARDQGQGSDRSQQSFLAAAIILRGPAALCEALSSRVGKKLRDYLGTATIPGAGKAIVPSELQFDSTWLSATPATLMRKEWLRLHLSFSRSSYQYSRFDIMFWLATLAFAKDADMDIVQAIGALYRVNQLASISIPDILEFQLEHGDCPQLQTIEKLIKGCRPFNGSPESSVPRNSGETHWQWQQRMQRHFQDKQKAAINRLARVLSDQWPCRHPVSPTDPDIVVYIDTATAIGDISARFSACYDNRQLYEYLDTLVTVLQQQPVIGAAYASSTVSSQHPGVSAAAQHVSLRDAFLSPPPPLPDAPHEPYAFANQQPGTTRVWATTNPLAFLCEDLKRHAKSKEEHKYVADLKESSRALQVIDNQMASAPSASEITGYLLECREHFDEMTRLMNAATGNASLSNTIAKRAQLSTRVSPVFLLSQLNLANWATLSADWKRTVVKYGLAVTKFQRAQRLSTLPVGSLDLADELHNFGHTNWDPFESPEALLLEAESGILIREVQEEIARQMRDPPNSHNAVMQLNMGEGKSSIIIPLVAAFLADGRILVRIIVAKPQSRQMFEMLVSKVGGLLNRRVYHMPFSRVLKLDNTQAQMIRDMIEECRTNRGILLLQPEHILSFGLMGIECLLSERDTIGRTLLDTQRFFDTHSRDLVDESDENFSPKFELVYTMGAQQPIQMSPERWTLTHHVLHLVQRFALDVKHELPAAIEVEDRFAERFPRLRILRADAKDKLLHSVANHICSVGLPQFPLARQTQLVRDSVCRYITEPEVPQADVSTVENGNFWTDSTKDTLLLVRGLIAEGVLGFALSSKRWRVNYGLDGSRSPPMKLAVPYRSKDNPSSRSEFSHPDVVIVLTSLTYYYGGLTDDDLFDTLSHLIRSDQADIEYAEWVSTAEGLPTAFRQLSGVNIKDRFQCEQEIFPYLNYAKSAIDYFLSHIVFPKAMKEFPQKLSASGWDIGVKKSHPTTGFSGTNDSRHVLPLSVHHLDLPKQRHTNALVLAHLLQSENDVQVLPQRRAKTTTDAQHLLDVVTTMTYRTRVILDVGAQILELTNYQVASTWLRMLSSEDTKAVVYFNDDEQLSVLDRTGRVESLQTSPYAQQLDACLVYLDEAHTRGTDLKLPRDYRAAVTLGAKITKDRLVQACMRMRKLGRGQSVVFLVPQEIENKILDQRHKPRDNSITVSDVLCWAITETWADLRASIPLWAMQGRRFESHKHLLNGPETTTEQAAGFLEDEAQTLDYRYRPRSHLENNSFGDTSWDTNNPQIAEILSRCQDFGSTTFTSATLQEEQERELSPEIEQERQVERPAPMEAEKHTIHLDVHTLIDNGHLTTDSEAFIPAFSSLQTTSAAQHFDVHQFPNDVLVTDDFARTVKQPSGVAGSKFVSDSYQRPVQWIVSVPSSSGKIEKLVIISPFEANKLLPVVREKQTVTLHLYLPRPNIGHAPLDALDLYTVGKVFNTQSIPRSLTVNLNLFSGQLYLRSYAEYLELCQFLGLASHATKDGENVNADGFIEGSIGLWGFKVSPVEFLRLLMMKIRRDCEGVEKTHVGKVLAGGLLEEVDFEG